VINPRNRAGLEPAETALRLLLESRRERGRAPRAGVSARARCDDQADWQTVALEQLADGVLFMARRNRVLEDEIRSLREEIRRLRARPSAA
jgi:hypothetical protein